MKIFETVVEDCGKPDLVQLELERSDHRYSMEKDLGGSDGRWGGWLKPSCIPITIILVLIVLVVLLPLLDQHKEAVDKQQINKFLSTWDRCKDQCTATLVESIPEDLTFSSGAVSFVSVFEGWRNLIRISRQSIKIASSYWTLRNSDKTAWQGELIFDELVSAGRDRQIPIRIVQDFQSNADTFELQNQNVAEVRSLNFRGLKIGSGNGIQHAKFWLVDDKHFYIGSANMDWRSLTQVKEVGIIVYNCSCLAEDLHKIFEIYWKSGLKDSVIPTSWPNTLETDFNNTHPALVKLNSTRSRVYLASSPPQLCTKERTTDLDAILGVIDNAQQFINIAVMEYFPTNENPRHTKFWPVIDDRIREVAIEKGVHIRFLASHWNRTMRSMPYYLNSLAALNNTYAGIRVEVKLFQVPVFKEEQRLIPYARVNHNKYMVTDNGAYIGTSNWAADYFLNYGGVSIVINQTQSFDLEDGNQTIFTPGSTAEPFREQLQSLFERDWNSEYAIPLSEFLAKYPN